MFPICMGRLCLSGIVGSAVPVVRDDKGRWCCLAGRFSKGRRIQSLEYFCRIAYSFRSDFPSSAVVFAHQPAFPALIGICGYVSPRLTCGYFYLLPLQIHTQRLVRVIAKGYRIPAATIFYRLIWPNRGSLSSGTLRWFDTWRACF